MTALITDWLTGRFYKLFILIGLFSLVAEKVEKTANFDFLGSRTVLDSSKLISAEVFLVIVDSLCIVCNKWALFYANF